MKLLRIPGKSVVILSLFLLMGLSLIPLCFSQFPPFLPPNPISAEVKPDISIEMNVIPLLELTEENNIFTFRWDNKPYKNTSEPPACSFELALMVNVSSLLANFQTVTISSFLSGSLTAKNNVIIKKQNQTRYEFGLSISQIEESMANKTENLFWKIQNQNFDVKEISLEEIGNITRIHLPLNLVLSFEDLDAYGYNTEQLNKTHTKITGITGETSWNLDPYVYSSDIISASGGSEGSEIGCKDFWDADKNGTYDVVVRENITGTDANPVAVDYPIRPADEKVLGGTPTPLDLWINVTDWVWMADASVRIYGWERGGWYTSESKLFSDAGVFYLGKAFVQINQTEVYYYSGVPGLSHFNYTITQGQWGVVWNTNDTQFMFDCRLKIDGEAADSWFADEDKQIVFSNASVTANNQVLIEVDSQNSTHRGHLRFGNVVNATHKTSGNGVHFSFKNTSYTGTVFIRNTITTWGVINLYSSVFSSVETSARIQALYNSSVWNCVLDGVRFAGVYSGSDFYNVIIKNGDYAFTGSIAGSFDTIIIHNTDRVLQFIESGDVEISNTIISNVTQAAFEHIFIPFGANNDLELINVECDLWSFTWGAVCQVNANRRYDFDLAFTFSNGSFAQGTNVTISNSYSGTSESWILSSNGSIPSQIYSMGHYNKAGGNSIFNHNPYNITAALDGYQTYTTLINITEKMDLIVSLSPAADRGEYVAVLLAVSLIFVPLLIVVIYLLARRKH